MNDPQDKLASKRNTAGLIDSFSIVGLDSPFRYYLESTYVLLLAQNEFIIKTHTFPSRVFATLCAEMREIKTPTFVAGEILTCKRSISCLCWQLQSVNCCHSQGPLLWPLFNQLLAFYWTLSTTTPFRLLWPPSSGVYYWPGFSWELDGH